MTMAVSMASVTTAETGLKEGWAGCWDGHDI